MNDANADLVNELRIPSDADDEAIQEVLKNLFNAQCSNQCRIQSDSVSVEDQAIRAQSSDSDQAVKAKSTAQALKATESDRIQSSSVSESKTGPSPVQDQFSVSVSKISQESQCTLLSSRSSISIDNSLREEIYSLLQKENYYKEILEEIESTGRKRIEKGTRKISNEEKVINDSYRWAAGGCRVLESGCPGRFRSEVSPG